MKHEKSTRLLFLGIAFVSSIRARESRFRLVRFIKQGSESFPFLIFPNIFTLSKDLLAKAAERSGALATCWLI